MAGFIAAVAGPAGVGSRLLVESGVALEFLDPGPFLPLDERAIFASVKKTCELLVLHEDARTGGIPGKIAMHVSEGALEWRDAPIRRETAIGNPVPHAGSLEGRPLPQASDILEAARYLADYRRADKLNLLEGVADRAHIRNQPQSGE